MMHQGSRRAPIAFQFGNGYSNMNQETCMAEPATSADQLREQIVERFKTIEKSAAQRVENAVADTTELLEARAARLQAEIELLRERANGK